MKLRMMRLPFIAVFRMSKHICACGKPSFPRNSLWCRHFRTHGGIPVVMGEPSLWKPGIRSMGSSRMDEIPAPGLVGTCGLDAGADGPTVRLPEQEQGYTPAALLDGPEVATSAISAGVFNELDRVDATSASSAGISNEVDRVDNTSASSAGIFNEVDRVDATSASSAGVFNEVDRVDATSASSAGIFNEVDRVDATSASSAGIFSEVDRVDATSASSAGVFSEVDRVHATSASSAGVFNEADRVDVTSASSAGVFIEPDRVDATSASSAGVFDEDRVDCHISPFEQEAEHAATSCSVDNPEIWTLPASNAVNLEGGMVNGHVTLPPKAAQSRPEPSPDYPNLNLQPTDHSSNLDGVGGVESLVRPFDLPLHLEERLLDNQYLKAHIAAMEEVEAIERNVEALYIEANCVAEKTFFEEPTRARVRSLFSQQSLEALLMKLLECGVLRAMSALCLLQAGRYGSCTREVVDVVCSLGFTARGGSGRERAAGLPNVARQIPGSQLSYYPKSLNNPRMLLPNVPCRSWPGLPRRLHAGHEAYQLFSHKHPLVALNGCLTEIRHGWYTLSPYVKGIRSNRLQVFKGLEDGVFHVFVQRQGMPCCWIHVSSYIEEALWPQLQIESKSQPERSGGTVNKTFPDLPEQPKAVPNLIESTQTYPSDSLTIAQD